MPRASRWSARYAREGHVAPNRRRSDERLPAIEAQADQILPAYEARPQIALRDSLDVLTARDVQTSASGMSRYFAGHGVSRKGRSVPD